MKINKTSRYSITGALFEQTMLTIRHSQIFTGMFMLPGDLTIIFKKYVL